VNRAAIENYTPAVRVGNQTALRTAHSPFSEYLTAMHRRIHRLFAEGFIPGLDSLPPNSPLNDRSLVTTLEIVLESDGRVARLGVVRTSGLSAFDVGALNAVRRSAPFGAAPQAMLSGDGRAYMHWDFHRDEQYCQPRDVEPYIIPNPGGSAPRSPSPPAPPPPPSSGERPAPPAATPATPAPAHSMRAEAPARAR
jgi:TonB family protein